MKYITRTINTITYKVEYVDKSTKTISTTDVTIINRKYRSQVELFKAICSIAGLAYDTTCILDMDELYENSTTYGMSVEDFMAQAIDMDTLKTTSSGDEIEEDNETEEDLEADLDELDPNTEDEDI